MKGLTGLKRGLGSITSLGRDPRPDPPLLLPHSLQETQEQANRFQQVFLRRPLVRRRLPSQTDYGPSELEARAAQDVLASLPERVVLQELRRRLIEFEFADQTQAPISVNGAKVDFLVTGRNPQLAIDIFTGWDRPPNGNANYNQLKAFLIQAAGLDYGFLWDLEDIFPSRERLELKLDELIGTHL